MPNDNSNHEANVSSELTDNELDAVSGGLHVPPPPPPPPANVLPYTNIKLVGESVIHDFNGSENQFQTTTNS
jgi:bacteriocin-like protein